MIEAAEEEKLKVKPNKQKNKFIYPFKQTTESFPYCRKKKYQAYKRKDEKYFQFTNILEQKTAMVKISICHAMPRLRVVLIFLISFPGKALPKKRPCWYRESQNVAGVNRTQEPSKDFEKSHKVSKVVKIISLSSRCRLTGCIRT